MRFLVECGFPNAVPEFILEYADDIENPTDTVYAYVPVELVNKFFIGVIAFLCVCFYEVAIG